MLDEQRQMLRRSSEAYDAGAHYEAKRLATIVFTLVRDGGRNNRSLLTQLDLKDHLRFISSSADLTIFHIPKTHLASAMVVDYRYPAIFAPRHYFRTFADKPLKEVSFSQWWEETIIEKALHLEPDPKRVKSITLSRKNLVFSLRDQDGGAHIDPALTDPVYAEIAVGEGVGLSATSPDGTLEPLRAQLPSMRQIAWELEQTLQQLGGGPVIKPRPTFQELQEQLYGRLGWPATPLPPPKDEDGRI